MLSVFTVGAGLGAEQIQPRDYACRIKGERRLTPAAKLSPRTAAVTVAMAICVTVTVAVAVVVVVATALAVAVVVAAAVTAALIVAVTVTVTVTDYPIEETVFGDHTATGISSEQDGRA